LERGDKALPDTALDLELSEAITIQSGVAQSLATALQKRTTQRRIDLTRTPNPITFLPSPIRPDCRMTAQTKFGLGR
jgi:hypothetical protein